MNLLATCQCLFVIMFEAIFASTYLNEEHASLSNSNAVLPMNRKSRSMARPVAGASIEKAKLQGVKRNRQVCKGDQSMPVAAKKGKLKLLIDFLIKELVKLVIDYFNDDTYPFIVSTHSWILEYASAIAVDSARVYVVTWSEGIKGLDHSLANLNENEQRYIEFGNPSWFYYWQFASSYDGRCVFFNHAYVGLTGLSLPAKEGIKWLTQSNAPEDLTPTHVQFDGMHFDRGILSQDGLTLLSYDLRAQNVVTRVYQIVKKTGKDPTAFVKFELNGTPLAISGNGNRAMVRAAWPKIQIHEIDKAASKLVLQVGGTNIGHVHALNSDGSEAAFVTRKRGLGIMKVGKVGCNASRYTIIAVPWSLGEIIRLVYSEENKLHVLHNGGRVSLFDPLQKALIPIETPQEGRAIIKAAISPDAGYIATLQRFEEEEKGNGKRFYRTTVKRKFVPADWKNLFGYERVLSAKSSAVLIKKASSTPTRNALPQSASRTRLTTVPVKGGSLCAFDGSLRYRYVLDDGWVVHRSTVDSDDDRGSVKLPASLVKGVPQHLQTNSDGTIFYVAAKRNKRRYIYVINVASKEAYRYRLEHLESDIVEMKAHLGGKVLEVVTQDQLVLVFSCDNQQLYLRNKLVEGERVVGVSQSVAVFEDEEVAGPTFGYFDLTKTAASLYSLPYQNVGFVAVDKDDIYLTNTKSILRFNVKTKKTATIERHYNVRYSQVHDGSIRIIDHDFVYRVLDSKTLCQLYETRLPLLVRQNDKTQISISPDGQRVMVRHAAIAYLFEIVDPEFIRKTQTIKRPAGAQCKTSNQPSLLNRESVSKLAGRH